MNLNLLVKNKIFQNTGWLFFDKVLRISLGLIVTGVISRYLGPELFGIWNYCIAFTLIFMPLANLELEQVLVKELLHKPEKQMELLSAGFSLRFYGSLLTMIIVFVLSYFFMGNLRYCFYSLILSMGFVFQSLDILDFYFQSQSQFKIGVRARGTAYIIMALIKLLMVYFKTSLTSFVIVSVFEGLICSLLCLRIFYIQKKMIPKLSLNNPLIKMLFAQSWPIILANLMGLLVIRLDQILIGKLLGETAIGHYSAVTRLTEIAFLFIVILTTASYPIIVKSRDKAHFTEQISLLFSGVLLLTIIGATLVTVFSPLIIHILYGNQYYASASILKIHIWTAIGYGLNATSRFWFLHQNKQHYIPMATLVTLIISIALNLIFIPKLGVIGAAMSTALSFFFWAFIANILFKGTRELLFIQLEAFINIFKAKTFKKYYSLLKGASKI